VAWSPRRYGQQGEVDGERVAEARQALSIWRTRTFLIREMKISPQRADKYHASSRRARNDRKVLCFNAFGRYNSVEGQGPPTVGYG